MKIYLAWLVIECPNIEFRAREAAKLSSYISKHQKLPILFLGQNIVQGENPCAYGLEYLYTVHICQELYSAYNKNIHNLVCKAISQHLLYLSDSYLEYSKVRTEFRRVNGFRIPTRQEGQKGYNLNRIRTIILKMNFKKIIIIEAKCNNFATV